MKRFLAVGWLGCLMVGNAAAITTGITDDPFVIGGGARPIGMGRAFTAIAEDADAPLINPAGIANLKAPQAMAMFTNLLGDVYYTEFCGAVPSDRGTFGIGYVSTGVNQALTPDGVYVDYHDTLLIASYSSSLATFFDHPRNVFFGVGLKLFDRGWTGGVNQTATAWSMDLGLKYILNPYLSFGLSRQNALPVSLGGVLRWSSGAEEAIAGLTKVGVAIKPVQFNKLLLIDLDLDIPAVSSRPTTAHVGAEWQLNKDLALRAGADQSVDAESQTLTSWNPTMGISFGSSGLRVDYAYHPYYNDSSLATSYVSISYQARDWITLEGETQ